MSDERETYSYDPLKKTHQRIMEEEEQRKKAEQEKEANGPQPRYAAMEQELAEKVRLGHLSRADMVYQLRRFDNELVAEMNAEDAQKARDKDAATRSMPDAGYDKREDQRETVAEKDAAANEHEFASRGDMSEARAARLARLRNITEELAREQQERGDHGSDIERDTGGHSR